MISIIITAFNEAKTIGKAVESILKQNIKENYEILVVAPDIETGNIVKDYKNTKYIQDMGIGKPSALNKAFKEAKGNILILTDGDVFLDDKAIIEILKPFENEKVGIVSGRPISLNSRENKWGYYSHLLTDLGAHETRLKRSGVGKFIVCSGYLYAFRRGIIHEIPPEAFSEDALISHLIFQKGFETGYAPSAKVYVKYPDNFKDWIKQKKRSTGGYNQLKYFIDDKIRMRSFSKESLGIFKIFNYPKTTREFFWTIELIFIRLYLWLLVYRDINLRKKPFKDIWVRVASTK